MSFANLFGLNHKMKHTSGITKHKAQNGLLSFDEELLSTLIKTDLITDVYDVEHTPFAR